MKSAFFEPGVSYANASPYATPPHLQIIHRFQCLAVAPHPGTGVLAAVGWAEIQPGVWVVGGVSTEYFRADDWTETS